MPIWEPCDDCGEMWCSLHNMHTDECDCPYIGDWKNSPYSEPKIKKYEEISVNWTAEERLRVVSAMLPDMHAGIREGSYGKDGRPDITSLQHVLHDPPEVLEGCRGILENFVSLHESHYSMGEKPN